MVILGGGVDCGRLCGCDRARADVRPVIPAPMIRIPKDLVLGSAGLLAIIAV